MSDNGTNPPRGKFDPGWNDPPKLQYNATQSGKTKLNLNKRIAFPLQGGPSTSKPTAIVQPSPSLQPISMPSQPPIAIVPPMSHINPPPINNDPTIISSDSMSRLESSSNDNSMEEFGEEGRTFCMNTFLEFIPKIQETNSIRSDEVQRRINLMSQMWLSGTLNATVLRKLYNIANALKENNFNEAIENHRALVVDHSNVCVAWGAALRQIILTIQDSSKNTQNPTENAINLLIPATTSDITENDGNGQETGTAVVHHI